MKRKAFLQTACTLTAVLLLAAACTQDELSSRKGEPLPEGKYPMTFATTVEGVTATRATTDNSWAGSEEVAVQVGTANPKKYTAATNGKLSAATDETPFYWESTTEEKTVSAWYPYSATKPTTFSVQADQSGQSGTDGYQESDLIYAASQKVAYSGSKALTFKHLPVKVVVNLKADNGVTADEVMGATVTIINQSLQSGAITEETTSTDVTTGGTNTADWSVAQVTSGDVDITPKAVTPAATDCQKSVQALLVPRQMKGVSFIKVTAGGNDYYYIPTNETDANLQAGQQYIYTITVTKNGLTVTASGAAEWTGTEKEATNKVPKTGFAAADLKSGDYYYSDGTTSDGGHREYTDGTKVTLPIMPVLLDANGKERTVIGIVMKVGKDGDGSDWKDDCTYKQKDGTTPMNDIQGYVLALYDANGGATCEWGSYLTKVDHTDMNREQNIGFYGYKNTQAIIGFNNGKSGTLSSAFPATYYATVGYEASYPAPSNSSGWFLPSAGQCKYWLNNKDALLASVRKATGDSGYSWKSLYWSSSEYSDYPTNRAWCVSFYGGNVGYDHKDSYDYVRSCLAF